MVEIYGPSLQRATTQEHRTVVLAGPPRHASVSSNPLSIATRGRIPHKVHTWAESGPRDARTVVKAVEHPVGAIVAGVPDPAFDSVLRRICRESVGGGKEGGAA